MKATIQTSLAPRFALCVFALLLVACSGRSNPEKVYRVAQHQLPPEDVYARMRYGLIPSPLPSRTLEKTKAPALIPVTHFDFKKGTLEEAAALLAKSMKYRSYCGSAVANKPFSLSYVGTIDEIAQEIERKAKIRVVIDHELREVRFFPSSEGQRL